jgi:hypothetical protein
MIPEPFEARLLNQLWQESLGQFVRRILQSSPAEG